MKGATDRRVIVTALALATATLLTTGCLSPRGGTSEPAVHAAVMSRITACVTVACYWKSGLRTALAPPDSTKNLVGYSLSLSATQIVMGNVRCRGRDAISMRPKSNKSFHRKE